MQVFDNSTDGGSNITDQHGSFVGLEFTTLTTANCTRNSNLVILKETPSGAAISTPDEFFATFLALINITLERKSKIYKSNLFLFLANY